MHDSNATCGDVLHRFNVFDGELLFVSVEFIKCSGIVFLSLGPLSNNVLHGEVDISCVWINVCTLPLAVGFRSAALRSVVLSNQWSFC